MLCFSDEGQGIRAIIMTNVFRLEIKYLIGIRVKTFFYLFLLISNCDGDQPVNRFLLIIASVGSRLLWKSPAFMVINFESFLTKDKASTAGKKDQINSL